MVINKTGKGKNDQKRQKGQQRNGGNPKKSTVDTAVSPRNFESDGGSSNPSEQIIPMHEKTTKIVKGSFFAGLMGKIGYIKKDKVSKLSEHIENMFVKDEDGKTVVPEDIEKKFEDIRERIKKLLAGGVIVKLGYVSNNTVSSLFGDVYNIVNELLREKLTAKPTDDESMCNDQFDSQPLAEKLSILKERINVLIESLIRIEQEKKRIETSLGETGALSHDGTGSVDRNPATRTEGIDGGAKEVTDSGSAQENDGAPSENETNITGDNSRDDTDKTDTSGGNTLGADDALMEEKNGVSNDENNQNQEYELENLCKELERLKGVDADNASKQAQIDELKRQLQERPQKEAWDTLCDENTKLYESLDKYEKIKTAIDGKLFLKEIELDSLDLYEEEIKKFNEEKKKDKSELQELKTKYPTLQSKCQELENTNAELVASKANLQDDYNQCQAKVLELEGSDVGKLKETIKEKDSEISRLTSAKKTVDAELITLKDEKASVDSLLAQTKEDLANARGTISEKDDELLAKSAEIRNNEKIIKEKDNEICKLIEQSKKDNDKIKEQEESLEAKQNTISEKETEIGQLKTTNSNLDNQVKSLNTKVDNLEKDKEKLTNDMEAEKKKTQEKVDFINAERDAFAMSIMALAENLSKASERDFLGCCDEAFEGNRVSLQEKVAKPTRAFVRDLADVDPKKFASQKALEDAYYTLVKENMDSTSGLTRIAQWYAYSCIPFMIDENRSDGLFVRQAEIRNMYSLATKLLGMVGMEYRLPILFTERMLDDKIYDDVTGKRQLNIEYMCPTARSHKENIDCIDNSSVIIDVVEVGYCDNKGNNKNPQVII